MRMVARYMVVNALGIGDTNVEGSGIRIATTLDHFTKSDVNAMLIMSGCDQPRRILPSINP